MQLIKFEPNVGVLVPDYAVSVCVCVCLQHSNSAAVYVIKSVCANCQLLGNKICVYVCVCVCVWTSLFAVDRAHVCVCVCVYISTL